MHHWCCPDRNLRDWDLARTSRPRLCHKSRDRDSRPHISLMVIKANSFKNAAKNIWNVAKYQDKCVWRCYASIHLFWPRKICKLSCSLKKLLTFLCKDRTWCPAEVPMFWPAIQYWSMLFENVEKRRTISFYFKQAHTM